MVFRYLGVTLSGYCDCERRRAIALQIDNERLLRRIRQMHSDGEDALAALCIHEYLMEDG